MGTSQRQVGLVVAGAVLLAVAIVVAFDGGPLEVLLMVAVLVPLLLGLRHAGLAAAHAHRDGRTARRLQATDATLVAADAVAVERARLSVDIQASVTSSVRAMRELALEAQLHWDGHPEGALDQLQQRGREAMTDLRLLLGLLRDPPATTTAFGSSAASTDRAAVGGPGAGRGTVRRLDIVMASLAVLDAAAWAAASHVTATLRPLTALGAVLSCLAAATVLGRTIAPGPATVAAGGVVLVGTLAGHPVGAGFWAVVTVGGLAWSCAAVERRAGWAVLAPLVLAAALVHKHARYEPENLLIGLLVLVGGALAGLLVRVARIRAARAEAAASTRLAELDAAAGEALDAERRTVARDLHDVVSGGIGVIVLQAGAAQTLHGSDPPRAWRALEVVISTCDHAMHELDRLLAELDHTGSTPGSPIRGRRDLDALVQRMQYAGLHLETVVIDIPRAAQDLPCWSVAYRVVQEALTNVLRHAPSAAVHLGLRLADAGRELAVEVVDDGSAAVTPSLRGYGLVGLAERVQQAGGRLVAGPEPAGGFGVHAHIPVDAVARARPLIQDVP